MRKHAASPTLVYLLTGAFYTQKPPARSNTGERSCGPVEKLANIRRSEEIARQRSFGRDWRTSERSHAFLDAASCRARGLPRLGEPEDYQISPDNN